MSSSGNYSFSIYAKGFAQGIVVQTKDGGYFIYNAEVEFLHNRRPGYGRYIYVEYYGYFT